MGYLQASLSCLTSAIWRPGQTTERDENIRALVLSEDPIRLRRQRGDSVFFSAGQLFELIESDRYDGEWRTTGHGYVYSVLLDAPEEPEEFIEWHWSRTGTPDYPHMHVSAEQELLGETLRRLHVPTGRIAFEEVARFLIKDLGVEPARADWDDVLADTLRRFRDFRTWA